MTTTLVATETQIVNKNQNFPFFTDEDLKNANPYTPEEKEVIRQKAISDGCLIDPIVIWKEKQTLVFGYDELAIAQEFELEYEVKYVNLASKADCLAWISEKRLSMPSLSLFARVEIAKNFINYWISKDQAKNKKNPPLKKAAMDRFGRDDKLAIIAVKAGTSHNTVHKINCILESGNKDVIQQCREGELSITKACELVKESGTVIPRPEVAPEEVLKAEEQKIACNTKKLAKEVKVLAKYAVEGFYNREKLDEVGIKFFVLRWNEEHTDCKIDIQDVQQEIKNYGK